MSLTPATLALAELKAQLLQKSHTHPNVVCLWLDYMELEKEEDDHKKIINALSAMELIPDLSWGQIALLHTFFC